MNRTVLAGIGGALVVAGIGVGVVQARTEAASASPAIEASAGGSAWLHIRVDETGGGKAGKGSKVRVNVPLSVVEAALEAAPQKFVEKGRIKLDMGKDDHDLSLEEMRRIWKELKNAGDTELVSVEEEDEHVTVARKGDVVQVRVTNAKDEEQVHVDVPVNLVDAVLAGESESVDVQRVIRELRSRRGDIVRVTDKNSAVRIWIDEAAGGGAGR
jgi:2,4-dienoyl-CoA reductase-like NADH-dependent reductase (Old Yellow Enzyme family)